MATNNGRQKMKKNVTVTATDGSNTIVLTGKIDSTYLSRGEVNILADELRDRLMPALVGLRFCNFRLSKVKVR